MLFSGRSKGYMEEGTLGDLTCLVTKESAAGNAVHCACFNSLSPQERREISEQVYSIILCAMHACAVEKWEKMHRSSTGWSANDYLLIMDCVYLI